MGFGDTTARHAATLASPFQLTGCLDTKMSWGITETTIAKTTDVWRTCERNAGSFVPRSNRLALPRHDRPEQPDRRTPAKFLTRPPQIAWPERSLHFFPSRHLGSSKCTWNFDLLVIQKLTCLVQCPLSVSFAQPPKFRRGLAFPVQEILGHEGLQVMKNLCQSFGPSLASGAGPSFSSGALKESALAAGCAFTGAARANRTLPGRTEGKSQCLHDSLHPRKMDSLFLDFRSKT